MHRFRPAIVFAILSTITSSVSAQTLADVAKATEEQRAKKSAEASQPTKVYTNKDLIGLTSSTSESAGAQLTSPSSGAAPVSASSDPKVAAVLAIIRTKCSKDWPTDFRMQAYCATQQVEGLKKIAARNDAGVMATPAGRIIRTKCSGEWLSDFRMENYCEEQQFKALGTLAR